MPSPSDECYKSRLDILCMFNKTRRDPEGKPQSVWRVSLPQLVMKSGGHVTPLRARGGCYHNENISVNGGS